MDANEYEKLSKKEKRDLYPGKRTIWAISLVTCRPENPKAHNRRKAQKRLDDPGSVLSLLFGRFLREDTPNRSTL